jgi:predicted secreted protein
MATVSVINSTKLRIYIGGVALAHSNDASITIQHSPRDITTKDSAGWRELLEGLRQGSFSTGALLAHDAANGVSQLFTAINNRTKVTVRFSTEEAGDIFFQAQAYITSLEQSSPSQEDNASYTCSGEFTGVITSNTIT